jgi:hypothetical protein
VLVIEKTDFVGGTTAWSGGTVWIPANRHMRSAHIADTLLDAKEYLAKTVPGVSGNELQAAQCRIERSSGLAQMRPLQQPSCRRHLSRGQ